MNPTNMKLKSLLYDNIYGYETTHENINGQWFCKKPDMLINLKRKFVWCLEILRGRAIAVHFKSDEIA